MESARVGSATGLGPASVQCLRSPLTELQLRLIN